MTEHAIKLATPGGLDGAWSRFAEPLRALWPSQAHPNLSWSPLEAFLETLENARQSDLAVQRHDLPAAALLVLGFACKPHLVDRLVEALAAASIPAVCLLGEPAEWQRFQRHGIIFDRMDAPLDRVASMLFALAERQSAVEILSRELHVAQRCQGGLRTEMDRLHEELNLAATVQREFLPANLPQVPGLDLGVLFRPVNYVSGDIYNVELIAPGKVGLFIADAVGHGVPAALLTMVLCHNLTTSELLPGEDAPRVIPPSEVLRKLNDRLCEARQAAGRFATAVYALIDVHQRTITVAGAGHPPPMLVARNQVDMVETDGPLLGVFPDARFSQVTLPFHPGGTLLVYTDGLECAFPDPADGPSLRRGNRRYLQHLQGLAQNRSDRGAQQVIEALASLLDEQAGSLHQVDDVTALAVRPTAIAHADRATDPARRAA